MRWLSILLITYLILAALAGAQPEPNLLRNSGFEEIDETGKPVAWSFAGQGRLISDAQLAHSGRHFARVRFDDSAAQIVPVEPNGYYIVEGYVRSENPETIEIPRIKVYFRDAKRQTCLVSGGFIRKSAYKEWQHFRIALRAPQEAVDVLIRLIGEYNGTDWFYFDDVTMRKIVYREWPSASELADVDGRTIIVADLADVHSFASYRIPPAAQAPIDGLLNTGAWTGRAQEIVVRPPVCDFDIIFGRPTPISWLLIHALSPDEGLGRAAIFSLPQDRRIEGAKLKDISGTDCLIYSLQIRPQVLSGVRLRLYEADKRTAVVHEMQAFGVLPGLRPTAQWLSFGEGALSSEEQAQLQKCYPLEADRQTLVAPGKPVEAVSIQAGRCLNLWANIPVSAPMEAIGVKSVTIHLPGQGFWPNSVVEICLKLPEELDLNIPYAEAADRQLKEAAAMSPRSYAAMCRLLIPMKPQGLTFTIDMPDILLPPQEKLWLTLRAEKDFTIHSADVKIAIETCSAQKALPEYAPRLERLMRRLYSAESEAHAYDSLPYQNMILYRLTERMLSLDPDNRPALLIQRRMARRYWPVSVKAESPPGAPAWAVWGRHCAREWARIADWWLTHRWIPNGELGGGLNDDVEYTCHWPLAYLITGDERYRRALRAIADAVWEQSRGSGYAISAMDVEHAAEDSSCSLPQMLLCEYGHPVHVERMMKMSEHIPFWTGINEQGRRHFRSYMFNTKMIKTEPPYDIDHLYCALALCGATHLSWYCRNPQPLGWIYEYQQAWSAVALSTEKGKPVGALPCDVHFKTGAIAPYTDKWNQSVYYSYGDYVMKNFLFGAQELTRDPALQNVVDMLLPPLEAAVSAAEANLQRYAHPPAGDPARPESLDKTWRGAGDELTMWRATMATGKREYLVACLQEIAAEFERWRWLLTEAEPYTDRIPVPGTTLLRYMFLGGDCAGKTHVPRLGVSWEKGGTDFAAFVLQNDFTALKVLLYNFHDRPLPLGMRVWKLEHGLYEVSGGADANKDDTADRPQRRLMELGRYALIPLLLPARQTYVVHITQKQKLDPLESRADLAICPEDIEKIGEKSWRLTIHNIGAAPAENILVCVMDKKGRLLEKHIIPRLEAPADVRPKTATICVQAAGQPPFQIVLDPENDIPEIYEGNNRAIVGPPPERFVYFR